MQKFGCLNNSKPEKTEAAKCLMKLKENEHDSLVMKFRNAHFVAKHHKSFKEYVLLCKLDKAKGVDSGTSYKNDKAGKMFVKAIANVTKQSIVDKLKQQTQFFSITIDGSTDSTGEDLESIYVRTCQNGTAEDLFLHIGDAESACSTDIYNHILHVFASLELTEVMNSSLVGFCANGASKMQGILIYQQFWGVLVPSVKG